MSRAIGGPVLVVWVSTLLACSSPENGLERMRQQRRADSYEASAAFADGAVMRVPPAGTVTHQSRPTSTQMDTGLRGLEPDRDIPLEVNPEMLDAGLRAYQTFCAVCHGEDASGRAVMSANLPPTAGLSLLTERTTARPPGEIFALVSRGKDRMPRFDWALTSAERWAVVAYVQQLQQSSARTAVTR